MLHQARATIRFAIPIGTIGVILFLSGCPSSGTQQTGVLPPPPSSDTKLGPMDVFKVRVYEEKELSGEFRVSAQGTIDYPLIGVIKVNGLTPPQIAQLIQDRLAQGFLKAPYVSVFVDKYISKRISVFGEVKRPGTFGYQDNMSIVEAITRAGGLTTMAAKNKITVTRIVQGKSVRYTVPVEQIGEGEASNYLVKPGDIVFVPERVF